MAAQLTPIEALDARILDLCTRLNAATCELLVLIREFDERGGCLKWGLENTATWLAWRCDRRAVVLESPRPDPGGQCGE